MQNLILQPSEDEHFAATIETGRTLAEISPLLAAEDVRALGQLYGGDPIQIWGITPGKNDANVGKWNRLAPGDVACFVKNKRVIFWGVVSHKTRNAPLAEHLWGRDHKDQTWEYMYFLRDGEFGGPHMEDINPLLDYDTGFSPRGVMVLASDKAGRVLESFGSFETILAEEVQIDALSPPKDRERVRERAVRVHSSEELERLLAEFENETRESPPRRKRVVARALARNRRLADFVKQRATHTCEVCGVVGFPKGNGDLYAEVHHLEELGAGGLDAPSNMLCVCPTCHRRIHYGGSTLTLSDEQWHFDEH